MCLSVRVCVCVRPWKRFVRCMAHVSELGSERGVSLVDVEYLCVSVLSVRVCVCVLDRIQGLSGACKCTW